MATYYVAKTGNDSNPGTEGLPKLTINGASGGASLLTQGNGDTLFIKTGTYDESWTSIIPGGNSWATATTVSAFESDVVTIRGTSGNARVIRLAGANESYIIFQNLILDGINIDFQCIRGDTSGGVYAHHIRLTGCELKNARSSGALNGGDYWEYLNCSIHDNGVVDEGYGIYFDGSYGLVDGCDFYNNHGWGIHMYNGFPTLHARYNVVRNSKFHNNGLTRASSGGAVDSAAFNTWYNNLFYDNNAQSGLHGLQVSRLDGVYYNNTLYNNSDEAILITLTGGTATFINTIMWGNLQNSIVDLSSNGPPTETDSITTDPLFKNPGAGDFHLTDGSPAIDAGTDLSGTFTDDFDGITRPQGVAWDVGAYEFADSPSVETFNVFGRGIVVKR